MASDLTPETDARDLIAAAVTDAPAFKWLFAGEQERAKADAVLAALAAAGKVVVPLDDVDDVLNKRGQVAAAAACRLSKVLRAARAALAATTEGTGGDE